MITISKELALELLMQRVEYWSDNTDTIRCWREYLEEGSFLDMFEGELNPELIIDNLWVNDISFIDKKEIKEIVDFERLEVGEEINTDEFCGTIEYIGDDFVVILNR